MSPVISFTISTPGYHELAVECARRIRQCAGIDCLVLTSEDRQNGYALKFELARLAGGRIFIFADADWWMIRHTPIAQFIGEDGFCAVQDPAVHHPTFCQNDADVFGFPRDRYINSGFFVANSADSRVLRAFDRAAVLLMEKQAGLHPDIQDSTEQSCFCKALYDEGLPTRFLPQKWNVYTHAARYGHVDTLPAQPIAIHAAGVPLDQKMHRLGLECATFEYQ